MKTDMQTLKNLNTAVWLIGLHCSAVYYNEKYLWADLQVIIFSGGHRVGEARGKDENRGPLMTSSSSVNREKTF